MWSEVKAYEKGKLAAYQELLYMCKELDIFMEDIQKYLESQTKNKQILPPTPEIAQMSRWCREL